MFRQSVEHLLHFNKLICEKKSALMISNSDADQSSAKLISSINKFGLNLIKKLKNRNENIVFSQLSIVHALSSLMAGAKGKTLNEMMRVLQYEGKSRPSNVHNEFAKICSNYDKKKIEKSRPKIKLALASIVVGSSKNKMLDSYKQIVKNSYKSTVKEVDFTKNQDAMKMINNFVKDNTNGLIPRILQDLSPQTVFLLANAVYFKGQWEQKFDKNRTIDDYFYNEDRTFSKVKMMSAESTLNYYEDNENKVVQLKYKGNASMVILLPQQGKFVDKLIENLNENKINNYLSKLEPTQILLELARIKIEGQIIDLSDPISKMGAPSLFTTSAELSGIAPNLKAIRAIHKAVVKIDEEGTEAAAATVVVGPTATRTKVMMVDRPFVFLIRDDLNKLILFMGAIKKL